MSDINTNLSTRIPSRQATNIVEIFAMTDFPAPSGDVITLVTATQYQIKAPLSTSLRFFIPPGGAVVMEAVHPFSNSIIYNGFGTLFTGGSSTTAIDGLVLTNMAFLKFFGSALLFDLTGGFTGPVSIQDCFALGFTTIGIAQGFTSFNMLGGTVILDFENGVTTRTNEVSISGSTLTQKAAATGAIFKNDFPNTLINVTTSLLTPDPAGKVFDIRRDLSIPGSIADNTYEGTPEQFFDDVSFTGVITGFFDNAITEAVDSVGDSGGVAEFEVLGNHNYDTGQEIVHTLFVTATYNGTFIITVVSPTLYRITPINTFNFVAFVIDESVGTGTTTSLTCNTGDTSGLTVGEVVGIINTSFHDTAKAITAIDPNVSFNINSTFVNFDFGNFVTGGLNERDKFLSVQQNGAAKSSKKIALGAVNNNSTPTTITLANAYVSVDFNGLSQSVVTERFSLTVPTFGIFTYTGVTPFAGFLTGSFAAMKSGSTENYRIAMSFNGGIPLFNAIGAIAINSVSGPNGTARFDHGGPEPPVGSFTTITGFTAGNRSYNKTGLVTFSDATSFEIKGIDFIATGTGFLTSAEANYIPMEVKTTKIVVPLLFSAQLSPGDTIQLMVAGESTTNDLTVTDTIFGVF